MFWVGVTLAWDTSPNGVFFPTFLKSYLFILFLTRTEGYRCHFLRIVVLPPFYFRCNPSDFDALHVPLPVPSKGVPKGAQDSIKWIPLISWAIASALFFSQILQEMSLKAWRILKNPVFLHFWIAIYNY